MSLLGFDAVGRLALGQVPHITNFVLLANAGSYTITGSAATFATRFATAAGTTYAVTGSAATFISALGAASASYAETGGVAVFNPSLAATSTSYIVTGFGATFVSPLILEPGVYVLTASDGAFTVDWQLISSTPVDQGLFYSGGLDILGVGSRRGPQSIPPVFGSYIVTVGDSHYTQDFYNWITLAPPSPSWSAETEESDSWTPIAPPSSTWTPDDNQFIPPPVFN